ncbi:MAG: HDOD domain-containing protein [bacterium]|nr:HDOD domain-containing protein [bacterium]
MKRRDILVLESTAGSGAALANALGDVFPVWNVAAQDPAAAVSLLAAGRVEVVVPVAANQSAALLEWLRRHYPAITYVDVESVIPAGSGSDPIVRLAESVGRSLVLRECVGDPRLSVFASKLRRIPVVSSVYQEICNLLARSAVDGDGFNLQDVAELVGQDPGMAVKVLRMVNSAVFGLRHTVSNLPQAVALLGARRISSLVLGVSLSDQFSTAGAAGKAIEKEWQVAVMTAQLSRRIASHEGLSSDEAETAYLAGLLHNVGRLLLAANLQERYVAIEWPNTASEVLRMERTMLGAPHTDLGALLLDFWGVDSRVIEAAGFYTNPSEAASRGFSPVAAVHGAAVLLRRSGLGWDFDFMKDVGLSDRIGKWSQLDEVHHLMAVS